ncbi:MAG: response regulator [Proteobacteria bacterium]|nr:response regulator [Pseudomonadota bacterium]
MNIHKKLMLIFVFLAITPLLIFGYFSLTKSIDIIESYVVSEAQAQAEIIAHTLTVEGFFTEVGADPAKHADIQKIINGFAKLHERDIVVINQNRKILADAIPQNIGSTFPHFSHNQAEITAILEDCIRNGSRGSFEEVSEDGTFKLVAVPIIHAEKNLGVIILEYSALYQAALVTEHTLQEALIFAILFLTAVAVILSFFLSRNISKPIQKLSLVAKALGDGDFSQKAAEDSDNEIGELSLSFNKMADNIAQLLNQEKRYAQTQAEINDKLRREIEERTLIEEALRDSEELYRTLVENIDLGVALVDQDHSIIKVNRAHAKLLKQTPEFFERKKCFQEFEKRDHICPHCPGIEAMQQLVACETEIDALQDNNSTLRLRIRAFPVIGKDRKATSFIEVVENITERQKIETELQRTKHIELVGTLAGGIAHDFNNLLAGIMGNIALAKLYIGQETKVLDKLQICEKAVDRAKDLSQQLLTFSRGGSPVKAISSVANLLQDSVSFALTGSNISCTYDIPDDLWSAEIDSGQISQVFQNITTNSVQAMPDGGTIEVVAQNLEATSIKSLPLSPGKYIRITIQDHGPGIPPDILDKIFVPFFTTKKQGSGLGLATCFSIIKKHSGYIDVETTADTGTVFHIYLPANDQIPAIEIEEKATLQCGSGRILIMDDEEVVREAAADILSCLGYKVEVACEGQEAIEHYRKAKAAGQRYDAVILDLTIPGGMGGLETLEKLREYDPEVKAIVSSGYANNAVLSKYHQYGFQGIIAKPYNIDVFSKVVAEVVGHEKIEEGHST